MRRSVVVLRLALAAFVTIGCLQARAQDGMSGEPGNRPVFAGGQMVRGTVTAVAADELTIKTEAGEVFHVAVSANTRLMENRQPVKLTDVKVGDGVGAMGVMDAPTKTVHAVFVAVMDAEQVKKAREGLGKVYITGKVTAVDMDTLKITVLRPDGVTQVIGVDEGTSFRRGGRRMAAMINGSGPVETGAPGAAADEESVTLADVKVGDRVAGPGTVKNGVFVPTQLGIVDPSMMRQRRRRAADENSVANGSAATAASGTTEGSK